MNIEQQIEALQAQLDALREQCKQQPEFEYPIYMQSKSTKTVVKFDGRTSATVVVVDEDKHFYVGFFSNEWTPHTNTSHWQPIAFDEERGIADKQLCECWYSRHTHCRVFRFYDAVNKCAFSVRGKRNGNTYDGGYVPIPYAEYHEWAIEAEKTLED